MLCIFNQASAQIFHCFCFLRGIRFGWRWPHSVTSFLTFLAAFWSQFGSAISTFLLSLYDSEASVSGQTPGVSLFNFLSPNLFSSRRLSLSSEPRKWKVLEILSCRLIPATSFLIFAPHSHNFSAPLLIEKQISQISQYFQSTNETLNIQHWCQRVSLSMT